MVSKKQVFFQGINIVAFIVTVAVSVLAGSTTLLNWGTSGEVSDLNPKLITPAGFAFVIWGMIHALLLVFIVYQALPRNRDKPFLNQISILFALSGIWNISWLLLWHYQLITYTLILTIALLATLIIIYLRLNIDRVDVSFKRKISVHLPFSVYLGWISIATITNVAVTLTDIGWDGWGIQPVKLDLDLHHNCCGANSNPSCPRNKRRHSIQPRHHLGSNWHNDQTDRISKHRAGSRRKHGNPPHRHRSSSCYSTTQTITNPQ
jgi:hypothetical protein